jgi:prevent-host-death family protein
MDVGIRELKSKLSHYVHKASTGTPITVTDRGKPVARLVALSDDTSRVDQGIAEGWIEPARRQSLGAPMNLEASASVTSVLDEDRG